MAIDTETLLFLPQPMPSLEKITQTQAIETNQGKAQTKANSHLTFITLH
ncbi:MULTISPECIES: hypothetical protein [Agrobacterium]|nr:MULTISPECIES: hypothetical protein [Agrobacterium]CUX54430.1 hypothetical protein AGR6A_Lc120019 [Agrobacterium sp. NCPPB 925]